MDGIAYLPHEIIENILSRLPVKSLLRFKSVCKQWNATISDDPEFTQTHLRRSKNSSGSSCLHILEDATLHTTERAQLVDFENDEFRVLSALDYPPLESSSTKCVLCHCDGLYVICGGLWSTEYFLWNPSRRSYKKLEQYQFNDHSLICGICYDPLLKDYKVVMGDADHYAVYYCRNNSWSELKKVNNNNNNVNLNQVCYSGAVPLKGSVYWVCYSKEKDGLEIVYFDGRDEKFKNLRKLDHVRSHQTAELISSGDGLYFFCNYKPYGLRNEILFMKKKEVGDDGGGDENHDEWMVVEAKLPVNGRCVRPVCCTHDDKKIILRFLWGKDFLLYDVSKRCCRLAKIQNSSNWGLRFKCLFPYVENLIWH